MSLDRERAEEEFGLRFSREDEEVRGQPGIPMFEADLTLGGTTFRFNGKSEEEVLAQAERTLRVQGRIPHDPDSGEELD